MNACPYCHRDEKGQPVAMDTAAPPPQLLKPTEQDLKDLSSEDPYVREQTVLKIAKQGIGIVQPLVDILSETTKPGLAGIAKALGQIGDKRAIPVLSKAAKQGDDALRTAALWALAQFREPEVMPTLMAEAERPHPVTQGYLIHVLSGFQSPKTIPTLCRITQQGSLEAAYHATYALGDFNDPEAIRALKRVARQRDPLLRATAAASLNRLGIRASLTIYRWWWWIGGFVGLALAGGAVAWVYK